MSIFWRTSMKELAAQLDIIDDLIHKLHVYLEEEERRQRDPTATPPLDSCSSSREKDEKRLI